MSYDTGPQPIVAGVQLVLRAPVGVSSQQLAAVTLQNLSPLTLSVQVGPDGYTLPAYTAHQYTLASSGSPVTLLGTNNTGIDVTGISSQVDAIWFNSDEVSTSGTYPAALQPDPLSLGVAIGEILLAQGIPSVLTETVIFTGLMAPGSAQIFDISGFASISVSAFPNTGATFNVACTQRDVLGNNIDSEAIAGDNISINAARFAVVAPQLVVNADPTVAVAVTVLGSNRSAIDRWDKRVETVFGDRWEVPNQALAVGQRLLGNDTPLANLQGGCFLDFHVSGAAIGDLFLTTTGAGAGTTILASSAEMVAFGAGGKYVGKLVAVPLAAYQLFFNCTTAGNAAVTATLIPFNI